MSLNIDSLSVPDDIRRSLHDLSESIRFTKHINKGANGWLFFGENLLHRKSVAVKFYNWGGDSSYHAEPAHLARLNSPNVISVMGAALVNNNYAYFITPYHPKGDLDDLIGETELGNIRAVQIVRAILNGLSHLHGEGLLHRDLKPQNILLSDEGEPIIGDFGSVKKIPEGSQSVPGSGHAIIYRPPESVETGNYGISGDIYQVGIVLFQLLGGHFPYEESSWLNKREVTKYNDTEDLVDRQIYANSIILGKIKRGKVIDNASLPPWVCTTLKRIISKATHKDETKRYQSCSEFLAKLNSAMPSLHNWQIVQGCPTRIGETSYQIQGSCGNYKINKKRNSDWRRDNSIIANDLKGIVAEIEAKCT